MQANLARSEYMHTCKDAIAAYFDVKLKVAAVSRIAARPNSEVAQAGAELDAAVAVSRFAALGTYLANFRGEEVRARYTELSHQLEAIVAAAPRAQDSRDKLFEPADRLFAAMNEDCVRAAKGTSFGAASSLPKDDGLAALNASR
jgi:hypothetical protein